MSAPRCPVRGDEPAPNAPQASEPAGNRVWQACLACRRKKIKCDGKSPCHNCSSRDQSCEFPGTKDNASASRYYTTSFEARCQQMDTLCERLEILTGQLSRSLEALHQPHLSNQASPNEDLLRAAQVLNSMPELRGPFSGLRTHANDHVAQGDTHAVICDLNQPSVGLAPEETVAEEVSSSDSDESDTNNEKQDEDANPAGALVRDSYGRPRFIGGATHNILIEAAKSLLPAAPMTTPSSTGASHSAQSIDDLELPLFVRGKVWPDSPFIPKPETLPRPPQYIADLLISLYFDKLHYTFPVLFRPHFMRRYQKLLKAGQDCSSPKHRRFLMVFFAVCACSSSLLPSHSENELPGIEYYQKALLMSHASNGEASLERIQCLALLSMCSAGWNTLSQSWSLAGQAVRAALDMGLHLSSRSILSLAPAYSSSSNERLRVQVSRRVWWCVYTLDRVTSICLGRPMAIQDDDCDCELPLDLRDEDLEPLDHKSRPRLATEELTAVKSSPVSGFLAFARLCRLAGKIQRLNSPLELRKLASAGVDKLHRFLSRVDSHDQALRKWLESLPPDIQFSANSMEKGPGGDPALVMCVIIFILHAGSLLNLYRCFLNYPKKSGMGEEADISGAISQCVNAAQSCINAAEIVRDLVPTSHYLAICVHYMTLSGIVLLRLPPKQTSKEILSDVDKCVNFLKDVELRWSGARRSRAIIEELLQHHQRNLALAQVSHNNSPTDSPSVANKGRYKRTFEEIEANTSPRQGGDNFLWGEVPGSELFHFDPLDPVLFSSWG